MEAKTKEHLILAVVGIALLIGAVMLLKGGSGTTSGTVAAPSSAELNAFTKLSEDSQNYALAKSQMAMSVLQSYEQNKANLQLGLADIQGQVTINNTNAQTSLDIANTQAAAQEQIAGLQASSNTAIAQAEATVAAQVAQYQLQAAQAQANAQVQAANAAANPGGANWLTGIGSLLGGVGALFGFSPGSGNSGGGSSSNFPIPSSWMNIGI